MLNRRTNLWEMQNLMAEPEFIKGFTGLIPGLENSEKIWKFETTSFDLEKKV